MKEEPMFVNGNPINKVSVKKENPIRDIHIKKKKIISSDTNLELSVLISDGKESSSLMVDKQNRKYKRCVYCKHWYLLSNFKATNRKNSIGGVGVFCKKCIDRKLKLQNKTNKKVEDKTNEEEQLNTEELIGKPISDILSYLTDNQLLSEIKKRGYIGELVLTKKIKL
jgi:hypothetical protein